MANVNKRYGFIPVNHLTGGQIRTRRYVMTASATVYRGDPLKVVANGTVEVAAAADGLIVVGVAAEYKVASAVAGATYVEVWDDPDLVFVVQCDTALDQTAVFATADMATYAAGSATTGASATYLDNIGQAQFKIIGLFDTPDNAWGAYQDVLVIFNEHLYRAAVAGV